jgi:hypothetical protein
MKFNDIHNYFRSASAYLALAVSLYLFSVQASADNWDDYFSEFSVNDISASEQLAAISISKNDIQIVQINDAILDGRFTVDKILHDRIVLTDNERVDHYFQVYKAKGGQASRVQRITRDPEFKDREILVSDPAQ